jgi:hypothetical protein
MDPVEPRLITIGEQHKRLKSNIPHSYGVRYKIQCFRKYKCELIQSDRKISPILIFPFLPLRYLSSIPPNKQLIFQNQTKHNLKP